MSHFLDRLSFFTRAKAEFADGHGVMTTEDRSWEDGYRKRWKHDKIVRSTHGVNCTGSCSWKVYVKGGIVDAANGLKISPYEVLIVGSLVQKEAKPADFAKVARVIYNRLASDYDRLEFDSTVNYPLDRQEVATTDVDRAKETPWNTYAKAGLPATPICSPGDDALTAAEKPEPGDWLYFVTVDADGTTLFTNDYQEHLANRDKALQSGVLDSGR